MTAFVEPSQLIQTHPGPRDTVEFLLHDLDHMQKFVDAGEGVFRQQVGFFRAMHSLSSGSSKAWFREVGRRGGLEYGEGFYDDLNYVISDMNAPAMHCVSTLKARWIVAECAATAAKGEQKAQLTPREVEAFDRRFGLLLEQFGVPEESPTWDALAKLCSTKLSPVEAASVSSFFEAAGDF